MKKLLFGFFFFLMASDFRVALYDRFWDVSRDDPYVWVRFCETLPEFSDFIVNSGDPLRGINTDFITAINSVLDDYNNIETSYIRLELHPDTPNSNGLSPNFDETKAKNRIINVCFGPPKGTHTGHSEETSENNKLTGCKVTLGQKGKTNLRYFVGILTHEIGHCMGLAHPQDTRKSIMSYHRNNLMRLQMDDKMGITHLYPMDPDYAREEPTLGMACSPKK